LDDRKVQTTPESQFVVFLLDGEEFGISIMEVREIIRMINITRLPKAPYFIEGVINLRGEVLPVVNLRKRFDVPENSVTDSTRIVIVEIEGEQVGLIVDSVSEVLRLSEDQIKPPPTNVAGIRTEFLQGVGKVDDRLLVILKMGKLLTTEELVSLSELKVS
jgi:purine-binding chemotaxis protein CheW